MTANFDGIWELNIIYTTTPTGFSTMEHRLTIDVAIAGEVAVGEDFANVETIQRNLSLTPLDVQTDAFIALMQPFFSTTTDIARAELFKIPEGTTNKIFISQYDIALGGTIASEEIPAQQATLTFRSIGGSWGKIQFMEPVISGKVKISPPYTGVSLALANHITSLASPFLARDNTYMFANLHYSLTENEALMKVRYPR
jgi:hypothetical protein